MAKGGRKSWTEELNIKQRYADLSEKAFVVLSEMLDSNEKADRKWAVEQLNKGFTKMIPQDLTSGGEKLPTPILAHVFDHNSNEEGSKPKQKD